MSFAILVLLSGGCWLWLWLWFLIRRKSQWDALVDRENAFWVRKGLVSEKFAARIKRFEKGLGQKFCVGATAVVGTVVAMTIMALRFVHQ